MSYLISLIPSSDPLPSDPQGNQPQFCSMSLVCYSSYSCPPLDCQVLIASAPSLDSPWYWVNSQGVRKRHVEKQRWDSWLLRTGSLYVTQGGHEPNLISPVLASECYDILVVQGHNHVPPHLLVITFEISECLWLSQTNYWSQIIIIVINC